MTKILSKILPVAFAALVCGNAGIAKSDDTRWTRSAAPDASFSVETPCGVEELKRLESAPTLLNRGGVGLEPKSRVVCTNSGMLFLAGVVSDPHRKKESAPLFDEVVKPRLDPETGLLASISSIGGRRAFLNYDAKTNKITLVGMIEAGPSKLIFVSAGSTPNATLTAERQRQLIDRFVQSILVGSK